MTARRGRAVVLMAPLLGSLLLAGCASQISALAPVSGDTPAMIRTAAIDVLLAQKVTIREAPQCTSTGDAYSCVGSLTDGSAIVVAAPGKKPVTMTVMVGDVVVYDGSIQDVLDAAVQDTK